MSLYNDEQEKGSKKRTSWEEEMLMGILSLAKIVESAQVPRANRKKEVPTSGYGIKLTVQEGKRGQSGREFFMNKFINMKREQTKI